MRKVLLRTICFLSLFAMLLATVSINAKPVFVGFGDKVLNSRAVTDATSKKQVIRPENIVTKAKKAGAYDTPSPEDLAGTDNLSRISGNLFNFPSVVTSSNCPMGVATVTYSTNSIQSFKIPDGVTQVTIRAVGANGGDLYFGGAISNAGGKGAIMEGSFNVTGIPILYILAGQKGTDADPDNTFSDNYTGGGGGGTFVFSSNTLTEPNLLVAAGAGGGAGLGVSPDGYPVGGGEPEIDINANIITRGNYGGNVGAGGNGSFGTAGLGGQASSGGGGGAGVNGDGIDGSLSSANGKSPSNGGEGGYGLFTPESGGYGGGGASYNGGGGGGGGYSGGGGGAFESLASGFGGGGGSYISVTPTSNTKKGVGGLPEFNGDGYVVITWAIPCANPLLAGIIGSPQAICSGTAPNPLTAVTPAGGGTGTIAYQWQSSTDNSNFTNIPGATSDTYAPGALTTTTYYRRGALTVTDPVVYTASVQITVNATPTVTANHAGFGCVNDKIEFFSSPGASYSWTGPNGFTSNLQNPIIPNGTMANAGTYTVTVTNANGCSSSASTTVVVRTLPVITAGSNSPVCVGTTLSLTANGGVDYFWNGPNGFIANNTQNPSITNVTLAAAGTYTVKGAGANGCNNETTVTVTVNALPDFTLTATNVLCNGQQNGTITVTPTSGTPPFSYSRFGGFNPQVSNIFTGLSAGTYNIIVTDANGCRSTSKGINVMQPASLNVGASGGGVLCFGSATGHMTFTVSGGTAPYSYSKDGVNFQSSNSFTGLTAGAYTFVIKDANGCTSSLSQTLAQPNVLTLTPTVTAVSCGGTNGSISITGTGGSAPYSYSKDGGTTFQPGNTFNGLAAGTYNLVIKDINGCTATQTVTVTANAGPTISGVSGTTTICARRNTNLTANSTAPSPVFNWYNASNTLIYTGNTYFTGDLFATTTYYVEVVSNGCISAKVPVTVTVLPMPPQPIISQTQNCDGTTTLAITNAEPGATVMFANMAVVPLTPIVANSVVVTGPAVYKSIQNGANGCQSYDVTINVAANNNTLQTPTITADGPTTFCAGGSVTLTASEGSSYLWSNGETTQVITTSVAGSYTVTVTNASGCSAVSEPTVVSVSVPPVITITADGPTSICFGTPRVLTVNAPGGGLWNTQEFAQSITVYGGADYSVTVLSDDQICSVTATITITTISSPYVAQITGPTEVCSNGSIQLQNETAGGVWSSSNPAVATVDANGHVTAVIGSGITEPTYIYINYTVTNEGGCSEYVTYPITVLPVPLSGPLDGPTTICVNGTAFLNLTVFNGRDDVQNWTSSNPSVVTVSPYPSGISITGVSAGTATVNYYFSNSYGCTALVGSAVITVNPSPAATITASGPTVICPNGSVTLTASAGGSYLWSNGATTQSIIVNASGSYTVTVTSSSCSATSAPTVVTVQDIIAPVAPVLPTITAECSITVSVPSTTDNCAGTVIGTTNDQLTYNTEGTYTIHWNFNDGNGNNTQVNQLVVIDDITPPVVTCPSTITLTAGNTGNGNGALVNYAATANDNCSGAVNLSYSIASGSFFPVGNHTVIVTANDGHGNTSTCSFTVVILPQPIVAVDDDYTSTPINGAIGGATPVVLTNDLLNNLGVTIAQVNLTLENNGGINGLGFDANGALVIPAGTWEGDYSVVYKICDINNPSNCDIATVVIRIARGLKLTAYSYCNNDVPYVHYEVIPNFTPDAPLPVTLTWLNGDGSPVTAQPVATNLGLSGDILWPGAVLDNAGNPIDWPGWYISNGIWIQGADGFEGTRPNAYLQISVNPTETIQVSYPPASPFCNAAPTNRPPVANPDVRSIEKCGTAVINVTGNDTDFENGVLTVTSVSAPANGTVIINGGGTVTYTPLPGFVGTDNFTYIVTDAAGLTATTTVTIIVNDNTPPAVPVLTTVTGACAASVTVATTTDDCSGVITGTTNDPLSYNTQGDHIITWTFTDASGNTSTAQQHVIVSDVVKPVINCPADIILTANTILNDAAGATATYTAGASDNCGVQSITYSIAPGSFFPIGTTPVTVTVTDVNGNTQICSFNVVVNCVTPVFTQCVANQTVSTDPGVCSAVVNYTASANAMPVANLSYTFNGATTGSGAGTGSGAIFNKGVTTVTISATNICGTVTCSFTVEVVDNENPVIVNTPANINQSNDPGQCGAVINWTAPTATDNCPGVSIVSSHQPGTVFPVGTTVVTYTATDASGHIVTTQFSVTVTDNENPIITIPADITHSADAGQCSYTFGTDNNGGNSQSPNGSGSGGGSGSSGILLGTATATDNCGTTLVTGIRSDAQPLNAPFPVGITTIQWTVTDAHGHTAGGIQTVSITDDEFPVINGTPSTQTVANTPGTCGAVVSWTAPVAADNCPGVILVADHQSGEVFPIGTTTVHYTATDGHGHTTTSSFDVVVADTEKPTVQCPSDITVSGNAGLNGAIVTYTIVSADNCGIPSVTTSVASGSYFPMGTTPVAITVTDAAGNQVTCSFTITVINNPPVAQPDVATTQEDTPVSGSVLTNDSDTDGNAVTVTGYTVNSVSYTAGSTATLVEGELVINADGSFTFTPAVNYHGPVPVVNYTIVDINGATASATLSIQVTPVNDQPVSVNDVASVNEDAVLNGSVRGNDTESGDGGNIWSVVTTTTHGILTFNTDGTYTYTPAPNFHGTDVFTYQVCDEDGDCSTARVTINVSSVDDPGIILTKDMTVYLDGTGNVSITAGQIDDGSYDPDGIASITIDQSNFSCANVGANNVTMTVTDANGNVSTAVAIVTVVDNLAPVITCPAPLTVTCASGVPAPNIGSVVASDNCFAVVTWVGDVISNQQGLNKYTITRTYRATDPSGNTTICTQVITVKDDIAPVLTGVIPGAVGLQCMTDVPGAPDAADIASQFRDNCSGTVTAVLSNTSTTGDNATGWTVTYSYAVSDASGNTTTVRVIYTGKDTKAPVPVITQLPTVTGECTATVTIPVAIDNCGGTISGTTSTALHYTAQGTYFIEWTYNDGNGNVSTQSQTVIVKDVTAPIVSCPADITVNASAVLNGQGGAYVTYTAIATDNCGTPVVSYSIAPGSFFPTGSTPVTVTAVDAKGNTTTCTFTVTVGCVNPVISIRSVPTNNTFTGGIPTNLFLGYGAQSTMLQVTAPAGSTYVWSGNGVSMLSSTTSANPVFIPTTGGSYTFVVTVMNASGCTSSASITICVTDIRVPGSNVSSDDYDDHGEGDDDHDDDDDDDDHQKMCNHSAHSSSSCSHKGHNHACDHKSHSKYNCAHRGTNDRDDEDQKDCDHKSHSYKDCSHKGHNHKSCDHKAHNSADCEHERNHGTNQKVCDHQSHSSADCSHEGHNHGSCSHTAHTSSGCSHGDDDDHDGNASGNYKVFLCHVPPGNPGKTITLSISINAVAAHLTLHPGDRLGSCDQQPCSGYTDNVKPVISCPANVIVSCGGSTLPAATGKATATDNSGSVTVSYTDVTNGNIITRTWKATDAAGNYSTTVQVITVGTPFTTIITSVPNNSTYTGGVATNLYIGYGPQNTKLQVGSLPSAGAPYTYAWSGSYDNRLSSSISAAPVFTPLTFGYYCFTVTVTNKYGCKSTASINICVTDIRVPGTGGSKVYMTHTTTGKYGKTQTIEVPINQVSSHLSSSSCGSNGQDRLGSADQTPCNTTVQNSIVANTATATKEAGIETATTEEELKITVLPNPSTTYFTLKLESKYTTPVNLRVMDANGRVVDARSKLGANSTLQIGHNYSSGTYYAEMIQGTQRKVVQLIKGRG